MSPASRTVSRARGGSNGAPLLPSAQSARSSSCGAEKSSCDWRAPGWRRGYGNILAFCVGGTTMNLNDRPIRVWGGGWRETHEMGVVVE